MKTIISLILAVNLFASIIVNHTESKESHKFICSSEDINITELTKQCREATMNELGNLYISSQKSQNSIHYQTYEKIVKQFNFFNAKTLIDDNIVTIIVNKSEYIKERDTWLKSNGVYQYNFTKGDNYIGDSIKVPNSKYNIKQKTFLSDYLDDEQLYIQKKDFGAIKPLIFISDGSSKADNLTPKYKKMLRDVFNNTKFEVLHKTQNILEFKFTMSTIAKQIMEQMYFNDPDIDCHEPYFWEGRVTYWGSNFNNVISSETEIRKHKVCFGLKITIYALIVDKKVTENDVIDYYNREVICPIGLEILAKDGRVYVTSASARINGAYIPISNWDSVYKNKIIIPVMVAHFGNKSSDIVYVKNIESYILGK